MHSVNLEEPIMKDKRTKKSKADKKPKVNQHQTIRYPELRRLECICKKENVNLKLEL